MSRNSKNILMILVILIMIFVTGLTINFARNRVSNPNSLIQGNFKNNDRRGAPPHFGGGNPPQKPDSDSSKLEENFESEIPDSDTSNSNLEVPNQNSGNNNIQNIKQKSKPSTKYYILFTLEGLTISALVIYLIMSDFNKKSFKETISNKDKIIIYVLGVVVLTGAIVCIDKLAYNKFSNFDNTIMNIENQNQLNNNSIDSSKTNNTI